MDKGWKFTRQFVNQKPPYAARLPPYPLAIANYQQGELGSMMLHWHIVATAYPLGLRCANYS